jgi:hypothetical protein
MNKLKNNSFEGGSMENPYSGDRGEHEIAQKEIRLASS